MPADLRCEILRIAEGTAVPVSSVCLLNTALAHLYAECVQSAVSEDIPIDAVAIHGQTVWHQPAAAPFAGGMYRGTLQAGSASELSVLCGLPVVHDFRTADMAVGGQGAPLAPMFDAAFLHSPTEDRIALNLGGIANITVIPAEDTASRIMAWDTGPANMLLDGIVSSLTYGQQRADFEGRTAARGNPENPCLHWLIERFAWFTELPPPKSTGRELFGAETVESILSKNRTWGLDLQDLLAAATRFTAWCLQRAVSQCRDAGITPTCVYASGGGTANPTLLQEIRRALQPITLLPIETLGIPSCAKEALIFAWLGWCRLTDTAVHIPRITGASRAVKLGTVVMPP